MIFRQVFEPTSCTYAYLLGCEGSGQALLVDGCGRTGFQGGDRRALFRSVREKRYALPEAS